jgi:predicted phage terminase large subunit-like protein
VRYWDLAGTEEGGDFTSGCRVSEGADHLFYIEHLERGQWAPGRRDSNIRATADVDRTAGGRYEIGLEQDTGIGGEERTRSIVARLNGFTVFSERPTGDKETRADPVASQMEVGNVRIVRGDWNHEFIEELLGFPNGAHDDQVDSLSGAFRRLAQRTEPKTFNWRLY